MVWGKKGRHPCMGLYLPIEVACVPIILCSINVGVDHVGDRW